MKPGSGRLIACAVAGLLAANAAHAGDWLTRGSEARAAQGSALPEWATDFPVDPGVAQSAPGVFLRPGFIMNDRGQTIDVDQFDQHRADRPRVRPAPPMAERADAGHSERRSEEARGTRALRDHRADHAGKRVEDESGWRHEANRAQIRRMLEVTDQEGLDGPQMRDGFVEAPGWAGPMPGASFPPAFDGQMPGERGRAVSALSMILDECLVLGAGTSEVKACVLGRAAEVLAIPGIPPSMFPMSDGGPDPRARTLRKIEQLDMPELPGAAPGTFGE